MAKKLLMVLNKGKERGASMLEYALLAALIAVICMVAIREVGENASTKFQEVANELAK